MDREGWGGDWLGMSCEGWGVKGRIIKCYWSASSIGYLVEKYQKGGGCLSGLAGSSGEGSGGIGRDEK